MAQTVQLLDAGGNAIAELEPKPSEPFTVKQLMNALSLCNPDATVHLWIDGITYYPLEDIAEDENYNTVFLGGGDETEIFDEDDSIDTGDDVAITERDDEALHAQSCSIAEGVELDPVRSQLL